MCARQLGAGASPLCLTFLPAPTTVLPSLDVAAHIQTVTTTAPHLEHPPGATTVTATTTPQLGRCCPWPGDLHTGGRGAGGPPCVPSVGGPPRGGVPQPIYYLLFTYTYHVLLPASTATFCFVCSTCDAAMDLLSAHATRLAPEQARLAPTAPRCVATGAWDKWLADHDVAVLAAWCHLLLVPTSVRMVSLVLGSMA